MNIGLFCSTPAVALGRAVPHKIAMEMLFTGKPMSAEGNLCVCENSPPGTDGTISLPEGKIK